MLARWPRGRLESRCGRLGSPSLETGGLSLQFQFCCGNTREHLPAIAMGAQTLGTQIWVSFPPLLSWSNGRDANTFSSQNIFHFIPLFPPTDGFKLIQIKLCNSALSQKKNLFKKKEGSHFHSSAKMSSLSVLQIVEEQRRNLVAVCIFSFCGNISPAERI